MPREFERDGRELRVRVDGQLILNSLPQRIDAAENGLGLAYVPQDAVQDALAKGRLVGVLEASVSGFYGIPSVLSEPPPAHYRLCITHCSPAAYIVSTYK